MWKRKGCCIDFLVFFLEKECYYCYYCYYCGYLIGIMTKYIW